MPVDIAPNGGHAMWTGTPRYPQMLGWMTKHPSESTGHQAAGQPSARLLSKRQPQPHLGMHLQERLDPYARVACDRPGTAGVAAA